jgi:rhomboid protease GluP
MFAGLLLEPQLGKIRFALLYFVAGIVGSLFSIWFHPMAISVGASGAIFGLYGALFIRSAFAENRGKAAGLPILNLVIYIGANLLIGSVTRGIDNAAHVGGLVSGMLMSIAFFAIDRFSRQTKCRS